MYTGDVGSSPSPLAARAFALAWALALACGKSEGDNTASESSGVETTMASVDTTDAPTLGSTSEATGASSGGTSTSGAPAVCDGAMGSDVFACMACTECGSWPNPPPDGSYPAAMVCMLEGLRDGAVVGATTESCAQGMCLNDRLLATGGTLIAQQMILNENTQETMLLGIQELKVKDASFFAACLAAYDVNCAYSNTWVEGSATDLTMITCP